MVGRAVGVAPGDAVVGDVELAVLEAAHGELGAVGRPRAVGVGNGPHRGRHDHRGGVVADPGGRFLDVFAGDDGLRFGRRQRGAHRRHVGRPALRRGDHDLLDFLLAGDRAGRVDGPGRMGQRKADDEE